MSEQLSRRLHAMTMTACRLDYWTEHEEHLCQSSSEGTMAYEHRPRVGAATAFHLQ